MKEKDLIIFDPRFGKRPARLIGRDDVLRDIRLSLEDPDESENITIVTGIKGAGKTALLSEIKAGLEQERVISVDTGAEFEIKKGQEGAVFFIDDADKDIQGLYEFLAVFQERVKEKKERRLFISCLPHKAQELLKEKDFPVLRQARRVSLGFVRTDEVLVLFKEAFSEKGKKGGQKTESAFNRAAEATLGYPYLIQLIGYYLSKEEAELDDNAVDRSVFRAKIELYKNIHEPIVWSLSSKDRMFLWSMSKDEGPSEFGEIAKRMDVSAGYASKYRERLIGAEVIYSSAYGELMFTLPYMKEYIEKEYIERLGGEGGKRRL